MAAADLDSTGPASDPLGRGPRYGMDDFLHVELEKGFGWVEERCPLKTPRLAQAGPSLVRLNAPRFFDFWGSLWGGAVSPILLAFLDWTGEVRLPGEVEKSRGAVRGSLWVPSGRGRRGASFSVLAPLNSLSS